MLLFRFFVLPFVVSLHGAAQTPPADLAIINAKVRTMTGPTSVSEALAVSGNRFIAVGSNAQIKKFIGPSTRVIDAGGKVLIPGFNDAHVHFMGIGNSFSSLDLRYVQGAAEFARRIENYVRFLPKGRWLLGSNLKSETWSLPTEKSIDSITPDNPVLFYYPGGQSGFANSLALKLARVRNDHPGVERDAAGVPTGIVRGGAFERVKAMVPVDHTRNLRELAQTATNYAASVGVTSVQDMQSDDSREIYRDLERHDELKTRVYDCLALRDWRKLNDSRLPAKGGEMVTDGCLKGFSDGDEQAKPELVRDIIAADRAGLQIMIHAIGTSANRIVLDVFEQVVKSNGARDRRLRVEHAHNVRPEDLPRFKHADFIASMQPFLFADSDGSRYGTLLKQNARVAFGSDAAMVDLNPLLGIHAAVTAGDESVSVYEAVRAYTLGSAFAQFQEKQKGTIESGKLADFVILSDDIFSIDHQKIRDTRVIVTVVNGRVVYESN